MRKPIVSGIEINKTDNEISLTVIFDKPSHIEKIEDLKLTDYHSLAYEFFAKFNDELNIQRLASKKNDFIVELEEGVWLVSAYDFERTLVKSSAKRFNSIEQANRNLTILKNRFSNRCFDNAKVIIVD